MLVDGRVSFSILDDQVEIKYQHLNPATYFREVVEVARSVVLAGGTMSPVRIPTPEIRHAQHEMGTAAHTFIDLGRNKPAFLLPSPGEVVDFLMWSHYSHSQPAIHGTEERTSRRGVTIQV